MEEDYQNPGKKQVIPGLVYQTGKNQVPVCLRIKRFFQCVIFGSNYTYPSFSVR